MKIVLFISFFLFHFTLLSAQDFVDPETHADTKPVNNNIGSGWVLDFSDEFNGDAVNETKWNIDNSPKSRASRPAIGIHEWYWRPFNVAVSGGNLELTVSKYNERTMLCGSINSHNKYHSKYGYYEARIKVGDVRKGTHTAFWLQGPDMFTVTGNGNNGAEIDIFESAWTGDFTKSVIHIDGYGNAHQANTQQYSTPGIHKGFNTFGMWWTKDFIRIYYNGVLKVQYNDSKWIPWIEEFLWLSNGASFGLGNEPDPNVFFVNQPLGFLTKTYVDYIRVWKQEENEPTPGSNLINNGTFDNQGAGWIANQNDIVYENINTGINGWTCRLPDIPNPRNIRQEIDVKPGSTYEFSFKGRIQNVVGVSGSQANNHTTLGVATLKGEIETSQGVLLSLATQEATTQELSGSFTVPTGVTKTTVRLSKSHNVAYLDDIELVENINSATINLKDKDRIHAYVKHNQLQIDGSSNITSVTLYDITGSMIAQQKPMQLSSTFNLPPAGIYVVQARMDDGISSRTKVLIP